jgi:hypothetical protein
MAIVKSKKGTQNCTSVVPDHYVNKEIEQLTARGHTQIKIV